MDSLPRELLDMIAYESAYKDLCNFRLVSKALCHAATKPLFSQIHVTPEERTQGAFHSILESLELSKMVDTIKFTTYKGRDKTERDYRNEEEESQLSVGFANTLKAVNRFPNLEAVRLEFAQVCSNDNLEDTFPFLAEESVEFRRCVLAALFSSLNSTDQTMPRFQSLSIKNLQNFNVKSFVESEDFLSVLSKIKELRLKIVIQYDSSCPVSCWSFREMHDFFAELANIWLRPVCATLESLTLHVDNYWGYIPKCDLRSLHFPKLRKLELGNFSFSHDWQLEWILSHGGTLEKLVLDDCPIVPYSYNYGPNDAENYPIDPRTDYGDAILWEYPRTWTHYFSEFQAKLPNLRIFRFGGGDWLEGNNFDGCEQWTEGLKGENYLPFNRGIGPHPWEEIGDFMTGFDEEMLKDTSVVLDNKEKYAEQDQAALDDLMAAVRARA